MTLGDLSGRTVVDVALGERSYPIVIKGGDAGNLGLYLSRLGPSRRVYVVTDANVADPHLRRVYISLMAAGFVTSSIVLPPGEATKSWDHLQQLVETLLVRGIERGDRIVALGGGVVGDLAGFASAIVKRGCRLVQVPTTLLAQVDSSVGGKTAINSAAGKNLVGAFHQPELVVIDPDFLDDLPDRQMRNGYAEVVKYGLIGDATFFGWCEGNLEALLELQEHEDGAPTRDEDALTHAIATCCRIKAAVVAEDERETGGRRALLNLGHTFGHALEAEAGFSDRLLHGEAVAIGMALAFRFSAARGLCPPADSTRVVAHLAAAGLPTHPRAAGIAGPAAPLIEHIRHDKKASGGTVPFILARGIGQAFVARDVVLAEVEVFLDEVLAEA